MTITADIVATYRSPRRVMNAIFARGAGEPQALGFVMIACVIMWVGQLPALQREVFFNPEGPELVTLASGAAVGGIIFAPIMFYGVAGLSHFVALRFGGQGSWVRARLALFWSLLAISPLMLLRGLIEGFIGAGIGLTAIGTIAGIGFLTIWFLSLKEAEVGE